MGSVAQVLVTPSDGTQEMRVHVYAATECGSRAEPSVLLLPGALENLLKTFYRKGSVKVKTLYCV